MKVRPDRVLHLLRGRALLWECLGQILLRWGHCQHHHYHYHHIIMLIKIKSHDQIKKKIITVDCPHHYHHRHIHDLISICIVCYYFFITLITITKTIIIGIINHLPPFVILFQDMLSSHTLLQAPLNTGMIIGLTVSICLITLTMVCLFTACYHYKKQ